MAKKTSKSNGTPPKATQKAKRTATKLKRPGTKAKPSVTGSRIAIPPPSDAPDARVLDRLWGTVLARKHADPAISHSARLLSRGTAKIAQKFGEEAVECLIEAVGGHRLALVAESADVLYHLLILWVDAGLRPEQIWAELARREGVSGITEKASRVASPIGFETTKIP